MAATPNNVSLGTEIFPGEYPTKTWRRDPNTGRLAGFTDGLDAMRQAVEIALHVRRFRWQIYTPNVGHTLGVIGEDFGIARVNLQAQIRDALAPDDRITGVTGFKFSQDGDGMNVSFVVRTVFGDLASEVRI